MESKKRKLEEYDHNNDQVSEPITSDVFQPSTMGVNELSSQVDSGHREAQVQPEYSIPLGTQVVGAIHQKFDCGYAVTFKVGQQLLSGVIYHPLDTQSGSSSGFSRAPLRQSRRGRPRIGSLLQPGSSSNPAFNLATSSYQMPPRFVSLHQPELSSNPAFIRDAAYQLQQHHPFSTNVNQLGSVSLDSGQQWNIFSRSDEVQQNPLPPCSTPTRSTQGPHNQLMKSPFWNSKLRVLLENRERDRSFLSEVDGLIARCHSVQAELRGLRMSRLSLYPNLTVQATKSTSTNVLLTAADQGGKKRSQVQWINVELPNVMQSEPRPNPSFPMQETRKRNSEQSIASVDTLPSTSPGSTSGNISANDESNRPVVSTAGQVLSATDTDRSNSSTESDDIQGDKKNADTSQKGDTPRTAGLRYYVRRRTS